MKHSRILLLLTGVSCLSACASAPISTSVDGANTAIIPQAALLIDKSANLYQVDDRLYRSEQLKAADKPLIAAADIKTIINLRYFDRDDDLELFHGDANAPKLINTPLLTWSIQPKQIAWVLHAIDTAKADGNVLVHCYHGADRTGIIIAMYRIIYQGWTVDAARHEMRNGGYGYHPIWKNLERLFRDDKVAAIKTELALLQAVQ